MIKKSRHICQFAPGTTGMDQAWRHDFDPCRRSTSARRSRGRAARNTPRMRLREARRSSLASSWCVMAAEIPGSAIPTTASLWTGTLFSLMACALLRKALQETSPARNCDHAEVTW